MIRTSAGTSPGIFPSGRSATVTPSRNSAHGAAAPESQIVILSRASGNWHRAALAATPTAVARLKGCVTTLTDVAGGGADAALLDPGDRHQERHEGEQEQVVENEDQHHRRRGGGAERREHQRRSHVADVRIGAGDALHHGLGHVAVRVPDPAEKESAKARKVAVVVAAMNGQFASSARGLSAMSR